MLKKTILLSGSHGVGKGYFLLKNFEKDNRFTILGASKLISKYKKVDDAGHKRVKNVTVNQQILLTALNVEKREIKNDIILDGHICIINAKGNIESIPESFFVDAAINGIILLQDDEDSIVKRQAERDGLAFSKEVVRTIQEEEIKYCQNLSSKHNISYNVIDKSCDYFQFCKIVDRM